MIYIISLLLRKIRSEKTYLWYLAGIIFFVIGSLIQAVDGIGFTLVFTFNKDSIYHLFVLAFLLLQFIGIEKTESVG